MLPFFSAVGQDFADMETHGPGMIDHHRRNLGRIEKIETRPRLLGCSRFRAFKSEDDQIIVSWFHKTEKSEVESPIVRDDFFDT